MFDRSSFTDRVLEHIFLRFYEDIDSWRGRLYVFLCADTHTHSLCGALTIIEGAENRLKCLAATEEYHVCGIWKQFNDRTSGGAWVSICLDQYIIEMSDFLWLSNGIQQNIAITCYSCWFLITCIWRVIPTVPIHTTHTRIHHRRCWRYCTALSNCSFSFTSDMKYRQ